MPEENKAEIKQSINESCGRAKELYSVVQKHYPRNTAVKRLLHKYQDVKD